ncbi:beta-galactosidase [Saccharibacillus kuerlensis]|uniref:Beta-galactosidase n=1 Tax=Saccharibacillus kuerlensis TaxID=459527 RepID=A0ABQ2KZZ3_9BACL|nr:beta-galactosidase [Saccharibacillus kuerlensis]GGN98272.1 beta-galactosidase [Saccharibacillus kuerlensis]
MTQPQQKNFESVRMGVDYYPEHWDETLWEEDASLMQKSGVAIVRVGEFAWSRMEPKDGEFDFGWLDRAIDLFGRYGIDVVIGTPTHTPPRWLTTKCPDVLPVMSDGRIFQPGVRGHRCFNSRSLRRYGERLIGKLAERYANHPAVVGWQTDNEFSMLDSQSPQAAEDFRDWVYRKYGTLENLNREWGTVVWSGEYSDWSEVTPPLGGSPYENPSFLLDFARFQWDSVAEFQAWQIAAIRKHCPNHFITHNFHSYPQRLDLYKVGDELDFASFDYYPNTSPGKSGTAPYSGALSLDVTRGIKRKNFWIMEQLSGSPGAWMPMWRMPQPGYIRAYAWQAIARGADTVVHFRWRSANIGAEQFWHGLIDHSNVPGRRLAEFAEMSSEAQRLAPLLAGTTPSASVAILMSHEQLEALRIQKQTENFDYYENIKEYHRTLTKLGIDCDVIDWRQPLDGYRVILAPHLYLLDDEAAERLCRFAADGGTLLLTARSGVKNMNNVCVMRPLPGLLADCAGVTVREYDPLGSDIVRLDTEDGEQFASSQWADILDPNEGGHAEVLARYGGYVFFAGEAAVTRNPFGRGEVYYLGTHPEEDYMRSLLLRIAQERSLPYAEGLPAGVQISVRSGESGSYLFLLNLGREARKFRISGAYTEALQSEGLLSGRRYGNEIELSPYEVEIFRF